jgi:DNA polymerase IV
MNIQNATGSSEASLRWLFLDMNSFFASCEQQERPELRGQPIAIIPMMTDTTCAIAASYEAKAFGVKTGTMVREAKQLCPALKLVEARPKVYVDYHHRFVKVIETFLPVDDVVSVDEVACRLDRIQREPAIARQLALEIKTAMRAQVGAYLTCSIGIASNKLLAKLASDMQKPDGLTILLPEEMPQPILHLELDDIPGIGPNMAARLQSAGINDMTELWNADVGRLRAIWRGVTGARFHALLHGEDLPSVSHPRQSLSHQHVLPPDERSHARATPVIRQLLIRAAQRLRLEGFYCRRLILEIKWAQDSVRDMLKLEPLSPDRGRGSKNLALHRNALVFAGLSTEALAKAGEGESRVSDYHASGYYIREQTFQQTQDTRFLLKILMTLWHAAPPLKPLRLGVTLASLVPCEKHQPDLFDRRTPTELTKAIDKLNTRYGRGTIAYSAFLPPMTSKISFTRVPEMVEFE